MGLEDDDDDEVDAKKLIPAKRNENTDKLLKNLELEKREMQEAEKNCLYELITRNRDDVKALCDWKGEFKCNGAWNKDKCLYEERHKINPYRSKEELVLFSTWNLDHKIERSRTLIPQILEASFQEDISEKDVHDFYNNLFTDQNLRLVHIVCHDKGSHK